jgi:hypothetical protein
LERSRIREFGFLYRRREFTALLARNSDHPVSYPGQLAGNPQA